MKTRFAPSPTGYLHIGNLYSAYYCQYWAKKYQADIVLRIEDIDFTRCKQHFSQILVDDLAWLGMSWHADTLYQHQRLTAYQQALETLKQLKLIYPCACTRTQIKKTGAKRRNTYPEADPYPGTCRTQQPSVTHQDVAWRLNIEKAMQHINQALYWQDHTGQQHLVNPAAHGDIIIARKDIGISYHLAVVVDDAFQQISHVIRGQDLQASTGIHRILQTLLHLPSPQYLHHPLLYAPNQQKWSKKDKAPSLQDLRAQGWQPYQVQQYVHTWGGFDEH